MEKEYIDKMYELMDDVISAEKSISSIIDKKEAEVELRENLYKEFLYVNREVVYFQFYDYLLRTLYREVENIIGLTDFNRFSFNVYVKRDGENIYVRNVASEEFDPKINDEFVISRDAYKRNFYNMELPELEEICSFYLGDYIHGELKFILEDILNSKYISTSNNEAKYNVGTGLNKSVRELKDYLIGRMENCRKNIVIGYQQLEEEQKERAKMKKLAQSKSHDNK